MAALSRRNQTTIGQGREADPGPLPLNRYGVEQFRMKSFSQTNLLSGRRTSAAIRCGTEEPIGRKPLRSAALILLALFLTERHRRGRHTLCHGRGNDQEPDTATGQG